MDRYFYLLAMPPGHGQLAHGEAGALLDSRRVSPRCVESDRWLDVDRTGYAHRRLEALALGHDLDEVCHQVAERGVRSEDFKVDVVKFPRRGPLHAHEAMRRLGAVIEGRPHLDDPEALFLLIADEGTLLFGRVEQTTTNDWKYRRRKPYTLSAAICPRIARACVNLVCRPGMSLIDPCCGSGTIAIEAAALGMRAVASDRSLKMAFGTRRNARHFRVPVDVVRADVRHIAGRFDALVTNLPYGIFISYEDELLDAVAARTRFLAERCVFIINRPIDGILAQAGNTVDAVLELAEGGLTRYIHVCRPATGRQM